MPGEHESAEAMRGADFWDRIVRARRIIDSQEYAVLSSRTKDPQGASWGIVHWKTGESLHRLYPRVYVIERRGRRIRNIELHPETREDH